MDEKQFRQFKKRYQSEFATLMTALQRDVIITATEFNDAIKAELLRSFNQYNVQLSSQYREVMEFATSKQLADIMKQGIVKDIKSITLDWQKPFIEQKLADVGLLVVQNVESNMKLIVEQGIRNNLHNGTISKQIRASIGLDERREKNLLNKWKVLMDSGLTMDKVDAKIARHYDILLKSRADTIAETETMSVLNGSKSALWRDMKANGILPKTQQKQWDSSQDFSTCESCASMHNQIVGLDEDFDSPDGPIDSGPLHPRCRCGINIVNDNT